METPHEFIARTREESPQAAQTRMGQEQTTELPNRDVINRAGVRAAMGIMDAATTQTGKTTTTETAEAERLGWESLPHRQRRLSCRQVDLDLHRYRLQASGYQTMYNRQLDRNETLRKQLRLAVGSCLLLALAGLVGFLLLLL